MIMSNLSAGILSQRAGLVLTILAASIMGSGCAMIPRENRPLTHALAEYLIPEGTSVYSGGYPMMAFFAPFTLMADGLMLHPYAELDDAGRQARDICWATFGEPGRYVSDCATLPVRSLAMPFVFLGGWAVRCVADVAPRPRVSSRGQPAFEPVWELNPGIPTALRFSTPRLGSGLGTGGSSPSVPLPPPPDGFELVIPGQPRAEPPTPTPRPTRTRAPRRIRSRPIGRPGAARPRPTQPGSNRHPAPPRPKAGPKSKP